YRPEVEWEWCARVVNAPIEVIEQNDGSFRMWGYIEEAGKYLRVITLEDRETIENAFLDRGYARRRR
ncbi:MAG TPA: hypothetical protein VNN08_24825, partial [Thermoanaerobaculia bacterium]|nr:hypothetical protein [Thermoanaerobaculia bacterium]